MNERRRGRSNISRIVVRYYLDLKNITGMKQRYIALKVVQILKKTYLEFDTAWVVNLEDLYDFFP